MKSAYSRYSAFKFTATLTAALFFWPVYSVADSSNPFILTYQGRSIDSAPYSFAFPYRLEHATIEHQKIYFSRHVEGEGKHLFVTDWDPLKPISLDSQSATKVTNTDLNSINFWRRYLNTRLGGLVAEADEDKAERINLWLFADGADKPRRLTDVDYIYEFTQSKDHSAIYYTARYGSSDAAKGCLEELTIQNNGSTQTRQLICDDNPAMPARINWWTKLRADSERVVFPALKDGDRNKQELYTYDLSDGSVSLMFEGHGKSWVDVWHGWGDEAQALFSADRDLYRYDFKADEAVLLRRFDRALSGFRPAGSGEAPNIMVTTETPFETKLEVFAVAPDRLTLLSTTTLSEDVWLADGYDGQVMVGKFSPETYAAFDMLTVVHDGSFTSQNAIKGLAEINDQLSQCNVERVQVTHEDTSSQSPGTQTLDVFIYRPRDLPPVEDQKFIVTAYYGGKNEFSSYHHLFCALGLTKVSPAVRGDWRYGTEFANSNDREKADAPIRDTLAVARYLMEQFDIPNSRQIGTTGYSHGGWAAVRAVSYPGPERLDLGFAIAGGGFYDLPAIVDPTKNGETNIHGWFDKEFGTADQQELLRVLSPSQNLDEITAPIFLYHADRDTRVSPNQSYSFAERLAEAGKTHELMIIPDQGHSIRGPEIWAEIRQRLLDFVSQTP
ncbi:alpha/beta hydrolase family protein [Roseovarius aestuarii]|uniref:Prolyl oligopeptidase family protein n=1 Tax=Roseovarius aestuarii TaxID=475083 RepID=A0A1X7BMI1_9RHOB|nr:prolyl oligopeptidase family serine peptidase [Roseovarius aestuarii]SMC10816.1 Prolyl oligopeptidase family protein [Roseovarius aestuarii]